MLVVLAPNRPQKTLAEVIEAAKKEPTAWTAATPALGSPGHIATIAFANLAGFSPQVIPYRGTAPALNDVAGGHVQIYIDAMIALLPMAQSGGVKPLGITSKVRSRLAPKSRPPPKRACPASIFTRGTPSGDRRGCPPIWSRR